MSLQNGYRLRLRIADRAEQRTGAMAEAAAGVRAPMSPVPDRPSAMALLSKLHGLLGLTEQEAYYLGSIPADMLALKPRDEILTGGEPCRWLFVARSGWSIYYKLLPDGRRQIVQFVLPGDIVDLHALFQMETPCSLAALTAAEFARIDAARLGDLYFRYPRLAAALAWMAARDRAMLMEQVVRLGRKTAYERLAHLLLELHQRLVGVGLAAGDGFRLPVTQDELADALGLSLVHVNRTLQRLRRENLLRLDNQRVDLLDRERLAEIAGYEPARLDEFVLPEIDRR